MAIRKTLSLTLIFLLVAAGFLVRLRVTNAGESYLQKALMEPSEIRAGIAEGSELNIFQELQEVRERKGYQPVWNGNKYILQDTNNHKEFDPFLWNTSLRKEMQGGKTAVLERWGHDVLFDNFLALSEPDYFYLKPVYSYELFGFRTVGGKKRFLVVERTNKEDYAITFEQVLLRNEAIKWGWYRWSQSEAVLREHGYIMMDKRDMGCVPVELATGKQLQLPARPLVVTAAIREINDLSGRYPKDFITKKGFQRTRAFEFDDPAFSGLVAKRILDLYNVQISWNKSTRRYEIVK